MPVEGYTPPLATQADIQALSDRIVTEGVDLSTKANQSDLTTTNQVVATKQTAGEPPRFDNQVVTADATVDPDVPVWFIDPSSNDVTLTMPSVVTVLGRQFTVMCIAGSHVATLQGNPIAGDIIQIGNDAGPSTVLPQGYSVTLVAIQAFGATLWGAIASVDARGTFDTNNHVIDTTAGDSPQVLPSAKGNKGTAVCYKNTGGGGHVVSVTPAVGDTLDGGAGPVTIADGKTGLFAVFSSNWITVGSALA